jgi:hypothetical protein
MNFAKWTLQNEENLHFVVKLFGRLNYFLYLCSVKH